MWQEIDTVPHILKTDKMIKCILGKKNMAQKPPTTQKFRLNVIKIYSTVNNARITKRAMSNIYFN